MNDTVIVQNIEEQVLVNGVLTTQTLQTATVQAAVDTTTVTQVQETPVIEQQTVEIPGRAGKDGTVIYSGAGVPADTIGTDGDWYIDTAASSLYGPKAAGAWGTGASLKGADGYTPVKGVDYTDGAAGANGRTILSGSGAPSSGLGSDGDFYIDPTATYLYGPKTAGAWPAGVYLKGADGQGSGDMLKSVYDTDSDGKVESADAADSVPWSGVSGKPSTFAPSAHSHVKADITDFPALGTAAAKDVPASGDASSTQVVKGDDTRLSNSRPASDVYPWAKSTVKPTYTNTEVGAAATSHTHAESDITSLVNDLAAKIAASIATTKGDLLAASAAATLARLAVGSDGQVLTAAAAEALGMKWATPSSGSSGSKVKMIRATRVCNAAAGAVSYTGVGFQPTALVLFGGLILTTTALTSGHGFDNGTIHECEWMSSSALYRVSSSYSIVIAQTSTNPTAAAYCSAFGSDGFTLTWISSSDTATIPFWVLCIG